MSEVSIRHIATRCERRVRHAVKALVISHRNKYMNEENINGMASYRGVDTRRVIQNRACQWSLRHDRFGIRPGQGREGKKGEEGQNFGSYVVSCR